MSHSQLHTPRPWDVHPADTEFSPPSWEGASPGPGWGTRLGAASSLLALLPRRGHRRRLCGPATAPRPSRPAAPWVAVSVGVAAPVREVCVWRGTPEPRGAQRRGPGGVGRVRAGRANSGSAGGAEGSRAGGRGGGASGTRAGWGRGRPPEGEEAVPPLLQVRCRAHRRQGHG